MKRYSLMLRWLVVCLIGMFAYQVHAVCEPSTPAIDAMSEGVVRFNQDNDKVISVKIADDVGERAAGFQYICADTIQAMSILFVFQQAVIPSFHMRNVQAALDIAFIDAENKIVSIQTMQPYVLGALQRPTYRPPVAVTAALEAYAGFFQERGIRVGDQLDWKSQ